MKKIKLGLLTLIPTLLAFSLSACNNGGQGTTSQGGGGGGGDSGQTIPEGYVRVTFYIDFNQASSDEYYDRKDIAIGTTVAEPTRPTEAPFPQFPNFVGWSTKEIIKDKDDLWNFSTTITPEEGANTFSLYGIWLAEGEQA